MTLALLSGWALSLFLPVAATRPDLVDMWYGYQILEWGWLGPLMLQLGWLANPLILYAAYLAVGERLAQARRLQIVAIALMLLALNSVFWQKLPDGYDAIDGRIVAITTFAAGGRFWLFSVSAMGVWLLWLSRSEGREN